MKKTKTLLGILLCLSFVSLWGFTSKEKVTPPKDLVNYETDFLKPSPSGTLEDCNINAGGDQSYCFDVTSIPLYGSHSGIDQNTFFWYLVSSPAGTTVSVTASNNLTTSATCSPSFLPGDYVFVLSGRCKSNGQSKNDTVVITITPAVTQAVISDASGLVTANPYATCTEIELFGNTPSAGETGYWSVSNDPYGHDFSESATGDTLNASMTPWNACGNISYYYTISNGGCISVDTVNVLYERVASPVEVTGGDKNLCGDTVVIQGSNIGCGANATATWQIIPPSGVSVPSSQVTFGGKVINVYFTVSGTYQIIYNVNSTGACPSGSDTATYNICVSSANGIGDIETQYVCDDFPDTVYLSSVVDPYYTYGNWAAVGYAGNPAATVTQTGTGEGYALIYDQSLTSYVFKLVAEGSSCTFAGEPTVNCNAERKIIISKARSFPLEADTLNIFCQNSGAFYSPDDYITTVGNGPQYKLQATQVPSGCTAITVGDFYYPNAVLDFSCEGVYLFEVTSSTSIGGGEYCRDTMTWLVNVASLQQPSAGSDSYIRVCDNETVPLVGSAAIDVNGVPNPYAISTWTQIDALPSVTFLGSPNSQTVNVTGFTIPGTYMFEYSFSREGDCYLADTMFVYVEACEPCPGFSLQTCCDLLESPGSVSNPNEQRVDPAILKIISEYQQTLQFRHKSSGAGCCSPCNTPTEAFPVFITDSSNYLIDPTLYTITWSNDASNHNNVGYILPNQQVTVTVTGPDSCVWTNDFLVKCCTEDIEIKPFCTWDPCKKPNIPVPVGVVDGNGNLLGSNYTITWSNGFTTNSTSETLDMLPITVVVVDTLTDCTYYDTFDIACDSPCVAKMPYDLDCRYTNQQKVLSWANIPGMQYEIEITYNDPLCCGVLRRPYTYTEIISTNSFEGPFDGDCFSWRVRSLCPDSKSPWSEVMCSCFTGAQECVPSIPAKLKCAYDGSETTLSWDPIQGVTYQLEIRYNDPMCCPDARESMTSVIHDLTTNSFSTFSSDCFSWRVRSICPNGVSLWSALKCSCSPKEERCEAKVPENLKCTSTPYNQVLSWDPIPGSTYEIIIFYGEEACCGPDNFVSTFGPAAVMNGNSTTISNTSCFAWRVRSVCPDGTKSDWNNGCSCADPRKSGELNSGDEEMLVATVPNPATDYVTFEVVTKGTTKETGALDITTLTGELVYSGTVKLNGKTEISLKGLSAGTYFYKVVSDNTLKSGKIVVAD